MYKTADVANEHVMYIHFERYSHLFIFRSLLRGTCGDLMLYGIQLSEDILKLLFVHFKSHNLRFFFLLFLEMVMSAQVFG